MFTAESQRAQRIPILCFPLRDPVLLVGMQARAVSPCPNIIKPISNEDTKETCPKENTGFIVFLQGELEA
jgi:hypothetical protein